MIEVSTYDYKIKLDQSSGNYMYRLSDYRNKDNWMVVVNPDTDLVRSMVERMKDMEESIDYYREEVGELRNIPNFISIHKALVRDGIKLDERIFIHDSHMGGWYYTLEDIDHEICEQCGDSDYLEWTGTVEDVTNIVERYIIE